MLNILIVEDSKEIAQNLSVLLTRAGYFTAESHTSADAVERLNNEKFDLVLLDIALPDGSGYSICNTVKKTTEIPVIMLTAMDDEPSIVTGFDLGADDYVTKPFKPMELLARIKNVLRRCGKASAVYQIRNLKIDTARAAVSKNNREIELSALEYRLLLSFLNHQNEVLSRNKLLGEIWDAGGEFVNDNTLTVYIKRLRDKIEDDPSVPLILKTVRGIGYRLGD